MTNLFLSLFIGANLSAGVAASPNSYQQPAADIRQMLDAEGFSRIVMSPRQDQWLKAYPEEMPSLAYISRPELRLAGVRFNPRNSTRIMDFYFRRLSIYDLNTGREREVGFPKGSVLREMLWSPAGRRVAVSVETETCHELWVVDAKTTARRRIHGVCLNAVLDRVVKWRNEDELFFLTRVGQPDKERERLTPSESVATGPIVSESRGRTAQNRTFQDLLKTDQDARLFELFARAQPMMARAPNWNTSKVGASGLYTSMVWSPDRKWLLVARLIPPFSRVVPVFLFQRQVELWTYPIGRQEILHRAGPFENLPIQGVATGPRSWSWLVNEPSSLTYVEALDGGDWNNKVDFRDEVYRRDILDGKTLGPARPCRA
jgi:hypothetical protein